LGSLDDLAILLLTVLLLRWRALLRPSLLRRRVGLVLLLMASTAATSTIGHGHDIGAVLERLLKATDVACDVLVSLDGEGDDGLCGNAGLAPIEISK